MLFSLCFWTVLPSVHYYPVDEHLCRNARGDQTSWWILHGTKVQSQSGTAQLFLQWHRTLQVDKRRDSRKLKGLNAINQTPFNSFWSRAAACNEQPLCFKATSCAQPAPSLCSLTHSRSGSLLLFSSSSCWEVSWSLSLPGAQQHRRKQNPCSSLACLPHRVGTLAATQLPQVSFFIFFLFLLSFFPGTSAIQTTGPVYKPSTCNCIPENCWLFAWWRGFKGS